MLALAVLVGGFFALQIGGEFYKRLTTGHPLQSKGVSHGWTVFEASDLVAQSPLKHPMYGLLLTGNVLIRGDVHGLALETPGANLQFAGSVTNSWIFVGRGSFAARNLSNSTVLAPTIVTGSVVNSALTVQSLTTHGPVDSKTTIDRVVWLARFPTNVYKGRRPNEMRSHP